MKAKKFVYTQPSAVNENAEKTQYFFLSLAHRKQNDEAIDRYTHMINVCCFV